MITKIDLKNGLYGIYADLKFKIHAISPKSVNKAAYPFFYFIWFLIQFTFYERDFPDQLSCTNMCVALDAGLFVHTSSIKFVWENMASIPLDSNNILRSFAVLAAINLPSISIFVPDG